MIREIVISARGQEDDQILGPPARVLTLSVIGDIAWLAIFEFDQCKQRAVPATATVEVPAQSLLLALKAAIDNEGSKGAWAACDTVHLG